MQAEQRTKDFNLFLPQSAVALAVIQHNACRTESRKMSFWGLSTGSTGLNPLENRGVIVVFKFLGVEMLSCWVCFWKG
jgi:hypothetical protein